MLLRMGSELGMHSVSPGFLGLPVVSKRWQQSWMIGFRREATNVPM